MLGVGGETRRFSDTGIPSVSPSNATPTPQHGYSGPKIWWTSKSRKMPARGSMEYKPPATKTGDKLSWIPRTYLYGGSGEPGPKNCPLNSKRET